MLAINAAGIEERLVVQHGASTVRPALAECVPFLDYPELVDLVGRARVVVTHGGVGSVMTALAHGKRPIVMPRRTTYGEAVDDHQVAFSARAAELMLVSVAEDTASILAALSEPAVHARGSAERPSALELDLRTYLHERLGPPSLDVKEERRIA